MAKSTTSSQSSQSTVSQCKAIAVSTKQRCTKSGKLDGYCSEKHREQGLASSQSSEPDSEIKKTVDTKEQDVVSPTKATKTAAKKPAAASKKPRKAAAAAAKKQSVESSDEFHPESDDDYSPDSSDSDNTDSDDDSVESEEDDDVDELTGKLASVKIKANDPTLPPKDGSTEPLKTKIKRTKSKVFGTGAILAPPKNKTKSSTESGRPTGGFWVPAPPPATIPESTIQILAAVKEKLGLQEDAPESSAGPHSAPQKTSSGLFSYRQHIHKYLRPKTEDSDSHNSKRAAARQIFGKIFSFVKKGSDSEPPKPYEKPLPQKPEGQTVGSGPYYHRPSVDALTQDLDKLKVDTDDSEVIPNQCQGYNKDGHRCKRKVKLDRPATKGEVLMCHDHEINEDDEVVVHIEGKGGVLLQWMDLASWVNPNLPDYVQNKLKRAMEKPISADDKPGYIYVYQLKESSYTDTHTLFKVGRTDNVTRRMNEWGEKCGSPPKLLEVFPEQGSLAPKDENDLAETVTKTVGDNEVTGLRCRYAHRVERLIHIELKPLHDKHHVCSCNTKHMEWFKVPHREGLSEEQQKHHAWLDIRRVIVHWMSYMEEVYGPG